MIRHLTGLSVLAAAALTCTLSTAAPPDEVLDVWPKLAPGESTREAGRALPRRPNENPPATRVTEITRPRLHRFDPSPERRTGAAVLIFPGGGYKYVVTDKEGSEAAAWLNEIGVTAFVVHYRTRREGSDPAWMRPLQDGQRAVSLVRSRAGQWGLDPERIGVLGFSAGGQAAALVATRFEQRSYERRDAVDDISCRPDATLLVYPWRLTLDNRQLQDIVTVGPRTPPTWLVHAHNDSATPLSSILFYTALKRHGVPGELHLYETGGHGYGMRPVADSDVDTWPARAADWLRRREWAR